MTSIPVIKCQRAEKWYVVSICTDCFFLAVFEMERHQAQHVSYQTYIIILKYECIFWKPELFVNRDLKISTYLNFSQNSFALGSPYKLTGYTTAKIFKLNIINLPLSKLIICTSQCSAHTVFLFCCISKNMSGVVCFTYLIVSGISKLLREYLFASSW